MPHAMGGLGIDFPERHNEPAIRVGLQRLAGTLKTYVVFHNK